MTIRPGERLRLSVQAAAWPAFPLNPGTGARPEDAALAECMPIALRLHHGLGNASCLHLQVLDMASRTEHGT